MNDFPYLSSRDAHASPPQQVLERFHSSAAGLDAGEAARRLAAHGHNRLPAPKRQGPLLRLLRQFHNVLLYMMLFASLVTALLGFWVDSAVILLAVVVNALIGFVQEGKAANALDAIRGMLSLHAMVLRDGQRQALDAECLVPGDVVLLASGDRVPADLRLFEVKNLHVDESALTGESLPVEKGIAAVAIDALLGDRRCMAYSGTLVTSGQARGVVVGTAANTELGRIGTLLREVRSLATPLLRQIARFSRWLALAILLLAGATFVLGTLWQGQPAVDMFMLVVALTASAIPEGLPAIMTVILALGVQRMARRNAIVSRLPAVETLGAVTVICSDKTGTLTRNEMTVQRIVTAGQVIEVSGAGYAPLGGFFHNGESLAPEGRDDLLEIGRAALLCNEARLHQEEDCWRLEGDPTEGALLSLGLKLGLDAQALAAERPRSDAIPFESEHRFMATLHHDHAGQAMVYLKGAPERILEMCEAERIGDSVRPVDPDYWRRLATDTAARGLRLLAIARRAMPAEQRTLDFADVEHGFTLLALVGIIDPPREEAVAAVAECQAAGIAVKMITGDHVDTARAIGAMLGIGIDRPALTGAEIELLDDRRLREVLPGVDVFARASPEHKLRLVQALQASGEVVAMTGDGVNDAPALKRADVGVAMGNKGTEAAKEAAEVVLADDNFATIANAVREGRAVYDNLKKFILFMLPTNGGEALIVIAAVLFQLTLPMTPAQILWINMVTSSTLGLALAFEPAERGLMQRPPRPPAEPLLSLFFVWRVLLVSLLMMAAALGLFLWELEHGTGLERARTMAVNSVVACEMFYLLNSRHIRDSVLSREGLSGNRQVLLAIAACLVLQLLYTYASPLQALFGSVGLAPGEWARVLLAGLGLFCVAELEKWACRRLRVARA
ncbi:cation-transporting P-type ATPase [Pseudomonas paraeruginosa]|uniref:cation-transporting P-type ATPase n=1 Tax=Pseudomonas aeruginosa group TaxID=136841 RepID=UPI0006B2A352|nr:MULTISPECIES: cation-transporting P-type ATPase [Pseudomonas aeruginosa group]KPD31604.1 carbonate dehydratase [Pseudomonas paraeruginosa]KQB29911.1 carbonate dehydratase [Pseudomonas paraeruginosa]KSF77977.1 carbonate dehydratase [Pseudomonas aeruginosa]MBG5752258.1 cation-transporting P-type ATPase [Pseudomonas aeruginosa]MDT1022723.1 cation-transporting P-type ATPase [Pseudomonas paraeruginosa]